MKFGAAGLKIDYDSAIIIGYFHFRLINPIRITGHDKNGRVDTPGLHLNQRSLT